MMDNRYVEIKEFIKSLYPEKDFIPLHVPAFEGNEEKYVLETIRSTIVSSVGKYVDEFEKNILDFTNSGYSVATVNGTTALHLALELAGVKRGDEVITQALTFVATSNAISYTGATPIYLDVDLETMSLSPKSVRDFLEKYSYQKEGSCFNKLTDKKISCCVPMHTFGHPGRIDELVEICNEFKIPVVEDSAESIGSTYKGTFTGSFGLLGAYSFNGNKTITCGGGGCIVTDNEGLAKLGKHISTTAKVPHRWDYYHDHIGYNYRMPNINAALACAQLEKLDDYIENKRNLAKKYEDFFSGISLKFFTEPEYARSNYWLNAIILSDLNERNEFLEYMNNNNIMCRPIWTLNNKLEMFKDSYADGLKNSKWLEERVVNIPSSVTR